MTWPDLNGSWRQVGAAVAVLAVVGVVASQAGLFAFTGTPTAFTNSNSCGGAEQLAGDTVRLYADCGNDFVAHGDFALEYTGAGIATGEATCTQQFGGTYRDGACDLSGTFADAEIVQAETNVKACVLQDKQQDELTGCFDKVSFKGVRGNHFLFHLPGPQELDDEFSFNTYTLKWDYPSSQSYTVPAGVSPTLQEIHGPATFDVRLDYDADDDGVFNRNDACRDRAGSGVDGCPVQQQPGDTEPQDPGDDDAEPGTTQWQQLPPLDRTVLATVYKVPVLGDALADTGWFPTPS